MAHTSPEAQRFKGTRGTLKGHWVPHNTRDHIVDYLEYWQERAELPITMLLNWLGLARSKHHQWKRRYGSENEHNGKIPRDWWLTDRERQAILDFHDRHPLEGHRRLCFMMIDADVVAVSPASVYRVLKAGGRHGSLKAECVRAECPRDQRLEEARRRRRELAQSERLATAG